MANGTTCPIKCFGEQTVCVKGHIRKVFVQPKAGSRGYKRLLEKYL